jgi:uncharacterized membrane protein HdeD (DUF308 family)
MQKQTSFPYYKDIKSLADKGVPLFKELPHLPKKWIETIIKILPILILIGGIFSIASALQNIFIFNRTQSWIRQWAQINQSYYYISGIFTVIIGSLYLIAYKPLKDKKHEGWLLLFLAAVLSVARSIVELLFGLNGMFGLIISTAISFYLLYEIRPEFIKTAKKKASASKKTKKSK